MIHYQRLVVALKETIEIMENINKAILAFPSSKGAIYHDD